MERLQCDFSNYCNPSMSGLLGEIRDPDEELLNSSLRIGDLWHVPNYLWFFGLVKGEQGDFGHLMEIINKLQEIGDTYDNPLSIVHARMLKTDYLIKLRNSHKALEEAEQGLSYSQKNSSELHELYFMGYLAEVKQLLGDQEGAIESISQAMEIYKKHTSSAVPLFVAPYLVGNLFVNLNQLEHAISSENSTKINDIRKRAYEAGKKAAVKNAKKYAPTLQESKNL